MLAPLGTNISIYPFIYLGRVIQPTPPRYLLNGCNKFFINGWISKGSHLLSATSLMRAGLRIPISDASWRRFGLLWAAESGEPSATPPAKSLQGGLTLYM